MARRAPSRRPTAPPSSATSSTTRARCRWCRCTPTARSPSCASTGPPSTTHLLEIPAGKRDVAGEAPEVTAGRELAEEVGLRAGRLELLAEFYNSAGFCDEHSCVFLATDLTEVATDLQGVEEEHMTIERIALADVPGHDRRPARCSTPRPSSG